MAYFEWADDMVIDGGAIDHDHQKLVNLVNELHSATTEGRGVEVIENIMTELIGYTREHLEREEQMMALLRFPNLERHKIGHLNFVSQLDELQKKYSQGSMTVASQLSTVLRDWLSLHIRRSDKEIKAFLQQTSPKTPRRISRTSIRPG